MEITSAPRSLRTVADLFELNARHAQERQRAIDEGIEQLVKVEEAKSKLAIHLVTTPPGSFEAKA